METISINGEKFHVHFIKNETDPDYNFLESLGIYLTLSKENLLKRRSNWTVKIKKTCYVKI